MIVALLQLALLAIGLGLLGFVLVLVSDAIDRCERMVEMREAARAERQAAIELGRARARMNGWVPR